MVTIESKNHSINLGGGGFICLRTKVAELAAPDIFEHYKKSMDGMRLYDDDKRKAFYKSYNAKITELDKKYKGKMSNILDFLYESDCDGISSIFSLTPSIPDNAAISLSGFLEPECVAFRIVESGRTRFISSLRCLSYSFRSLSESLK